MLAITTGGTPGATSGGTLVDVYDNADGTTLEIDGAAAYIDLPDTSTWVPFELHWTVAGEQTSQAVVLPATQGVVWSLNGTGAGSSTLDVGVVGNAYVRAYARASETRSSEEARMQRIAGLVYGAGVDAPSSPAFSSAPAITATTGTGCTFTFAATDPDVGDTVTAKYQIVARGAAIGSWASAASCTSPKSVTGLAAETPYDLVVQLTDSTGLTVTSSRVQFTTGAAADTTAPAISGTLTATVNSSTQVTLSGPTATDAVGIAKWQYKVGSGGSWVDIASTAGTMPSTAVTGLSPSTAYTFYVRALDAAGNISSELSASATTQAAPDATAPTISGTLSAVAGNGKVTLSGVTATDAVGVDHFVIEYGTSTAYGSTQTVSGATFPATDVTGLTNATQYYFRVKAYDVAGNASSGLTASATPSAVISTWTNDFAAGQALDTTNVGTSVANSGSASVGSNKLTVSAVGADTRAAIAYVKTPMNLSYTEKVIFEVQALTFTSGGILPMFLHWGSSLPTVGTAATRNAAKGLSFVRKSVDSTHLDMVRKDDGGYSEGTQTELIWNGATWGIATNTFAVNSTALYRYIFEHTATDWRVTVQLASTNAQIFQTSWVPFSDTAKGTDMPADLYICCGEPFTDYWQGSLEVTKITYERTA